ncbi:hypothetical protein SLW70_16385 [Flavobacterium sp. NG2]|uniref:hypothetical protein n=1 Tax=Flavobacterium sp. NG2 TaxID=3097547 RepID=UPI002A7EF3E3|nr:hypothetical protein [Flavobacterium sp. NG2]WPR71492.1 hypothetical protein SLW70_16385 [Flavobacterium sp. NG2]
MYIVREIFHLQFGRFKDAKVLIDQAEKNGLMPQTDGTRVLTDFTGKSYRLILESSYATLSDFEKDLTKEMGTTDWKQWYEQFKACVSHSEREILKLIS